MKKTTSGLAILFLLITLSIFHSCKKSDINTLSPGIPHMVTAWLDQQRFSANLVVAAKIRVLQQQLDLDKARTEELKNGEEFIIVPIKSNYSISNYIPVS